MPAGVLDHRADGLRLGKILEHFVDAAAVQRATLIGIPLRVRSRDRLAAALHVPIVEHDDEAARLEVAEVRRHLDADSGLERIVFAVRGDAARRAFERALGDA